MSAAELLLPYQKSWVEDDSAVKVWEKSRRIGASWCEALDAVSLAAEGAGNYFYFSYNKDMTRGFLGDCRNAVEAFRWTMPEEDLQDDPNSDTLMFELKFSSGKIIKSLPGRASSFRSKGKPGDVFGIDEAAFLDDLDEVLKAAKAVLIWGGKLRVWSTHNGDQNPFNSLVTDIRSGRYGYSLHRTTLDEALEDGLFNRICEITREEWSQERQDAWRQDLVREYGDGADEELHVIPRLDGGAWLTAPLIERGCDPGCAVLRWRAPSSDFALWTQSTRQQVMGEFLEQVDARLAGRELTPQHIGVDFARSESGDLSVFALCSVEQDLARRFHTLIELRGCPFDQQRQLLEHLTENARIAGISLDAGGNGQFLAEKAQQLIGSRAEAISLSESWYRTNMPPLKAAFEDGAILIPQDADVVGDLRSLQVVNGVPRVPDRRRAGSDGGKRHCDAAVAIALAYSSSRSSQHWSVGDFKTVSMRKQDLAAKSLYRRGVM